MYKGCRYSVGLHELNGLLIGVTFDPKQPYVRSTFPLAGQTTESCFFTKTMYSASEV